MYLLKQQISYPSSVSGSINPFRSLCSLKENSLCVSNIALLDTLRHFVILLENYNHVKLEFRFKSGANHKK